MTTLQALITKLGPAEEGSREFDGAISIFLGRNLPHPLDDYWLSATPHYTTSLDASLPGENIVTVRYDPGPMEGGCQWVAGHMHTDGLQYVAAAKTEILARRLACLKAMADG